MLNKEKRNGVKTLTVAQLIDCLEQLDGDSRVTVNEVGNLLILSADEEEGVGYIDFLFDGDVVWFAD